MIDSLKFRSEEKTAIRSKKKVSPDMGKIPVKINAKTTIWIKKDQDPEERKGMYLERISQQDQKDKKYK